MPSVVRIWNNGKVGVRETLIGRGVVLTAAHCLYVNAQCLSTNMSRRATGRTTSRSPGSTWLDDGYFSVFGNEQSDLSAPYETFNIVQMHVPRGGALGDGVYEVGRRLLRRMRTATTPEITRAFRPPM